MELSEIQKVIQSIGTFYLQKNVHWLKFSSDQELDVSVRSEDQMVGTELSNIMNRLRELAYK